MDLKTILKALAYKAKQHKSVSKKLAKSYVSLFLVLILGISTTFAWFTEKESAKINSGDMEFQSASSLRINKDKSASNVIRIKDAVLDEASSTDGRNIYFPLDKSFTSTSAEMRFREANAGDRITGEDEETGQPYDSNPEMIGHYVYKDFKLNGTSGNTPVYIKSYEVKITGAADSNVNATYHDQMTIGYDGQGRPNSQTIPRDNCPIRLAFIADSGVDPVVIDPSAQVVDYVDNSADAVSMIDENGVPTTVCTYPDQSNNNKGNNWNSFANYYYGNTPLFVIPGGETLDVTLVVWLEGSLPNCDKYIGAKVSVDIDIESNFAEMETIKFVDGSYGDTNQNVRYWVSDKDSDNLYPIIACSYEDPFSDEGRWKTVIMTQTKERASDGSYGGEWECKIPKKVVSKISFYRLSRKNGSTQGTIYNAWHTTPDIATWITASRINSSRYVSNPPSGWQMDSNHRLQTSRQFTDNDGNRYNSVVYTAVHGNGYSMTSTTSERLAPCVGYWDYSPGGGTPTPTQAPTQPSGGGSSSSTYNIQINVNDNTSAHWIQSNITNSHDKLYFSTANGSSGQLTQNGTNKFTWSGSLSANDEITSFYLTNSSGSTYRTWIPSRIFTVTSDFNLSYYVNTQDQMMLQ